MPVTNPDGSSLQKTLWHLSQVLEVNRLIRGPLLASIMASVILYAPEQVREIYRITAADQDPFEISVMVVALAAMFWIFWWVSFHILQRFDDLIHQAATAARVHLKLLPALIGVLPLFACAGGLWAAIPGKPVQTRQIDQFADLAAQIDKTIGSMRSLLWAGAIFFACLAVVLAAASLWLQRNYEADTTKHPPGLFSVFGRTTSLLIVVGTTIAVLRWPVLMPQLVGTLPLLALFFIAITLMLGHMTLWYEQSGVPFVVLLTLMALIFAVFDLNDDHEIAIVRPDDAVPRSIRTEMPKDTWSSFQAWYLARPRKEEFTKTYPVYVVAAQGGGIYAAYHAAILLSRMEDLCPEFRNHLFAISSVSGGSLGAAVFASVTKALAVETNTPSTMKTFPIAACPSISQIEREKTELTPGAHERAARKILSSDFLAPLAAATLFPDFTQRFLPVSVPTLDRAKGLEAAFEDSWRLGDLGGANPFEQSVLKLWSPESSVPALLINTTEADSGRQLVISPFRIETSSGNPELLQFPLWNRNLNRERSPNCSGRDISLSTAVSLSARFPWLTPAGSLTTDCTEDGTWRKSRLVDGGYFDNSGVDTALDLITQIESALTRKENQGLLDRAGSKIQINLIVLNTSEYPKRGGYGLGDVLEPIRALLSTRQARNPIAISRVTRQLSEAPPFDHSLGTEAPSLGRVFQVRFRDLMYTLPLGWRLSKTSRDIIEKQSGDFRNCSRNFTELVEKDVSNADCLQVLIFSQLNRAFDEKRDLKSAHAADKLSGPKH